jgi:hypothetical protein
MWRRSAVESVERNYPTKNLEKKRERGEKEWRGELGDELIRVALKSDFCALGVHCHDEEVQNG